MPPRKRTEPAEPRSAEERLAALEHAIDDLRQAMQLYSHKVAELSDREPELAAATEGLAATVSNLGDAIGQVNELAASQQQIEASQAEIAQAQIDLEGKVVLQTAFDEKWNENAGALQRVARNGRRYALVALLVVFVVVGTGAGWLINYQVGQNHSTATSTQHTETLNKQRIAACEQKNAALEQGVQAFGSFINQEKSLAHPDVVVVEVLELVRLSTQAQIIPCPGATPADILPVTTPTPGATPSFLIPPSRTPNP